MKKFRGVIAFFGSFLLYQAIGFSIFPVNEDNILQAPGWYPFVGTIFVILVTVLATRKKKLNKNVAEQKNQPLSGNLDPLGSSLPPYSKGEQSLVRDSVLVIFKTQQASISMIQRCLNVSYVQAAQAIQRLETLGIVSKQNGQTPRSILVSEAQALQLIQSSGAVTQSNADALVSVDLMDGHDFEYWCANLLRKNGYSQVKVTPGSGDQGVDILAVKDGVKFAIQCKRYSSDLGNTPIQEVSAGKQYYHCQVGVVMTNSHFTKGAKDLARATDVRLWDREKLKEFIRSASRS